MVFWIITLRNSPQKHSKKIRNFYVHPVQSDDPAKPWFTAKAIGRNALNGMVKDICCKGEISGNKTNHGLRATGVSDLIQAGVSEKFIQECSGHLSR